MTVRLQPTMAQPAFGALLGSVRLRAAAEDFHVTEMPLVTADGDGEHWLVRIRKRGLTTPEAARRLGVAFGVPSGSVSHAGLKDRHAVTEQWLSVHAPRVATLPVLEGDGLWLLEGARHRRKLRPGTLAGNRFDLRLHELDADPAALARRLLAIAREGVPNFFGPQRFGREGGNLDKALAWFAGGLRVKRRDLRGLFLSAARAELFNRVLAARVSAGTWNRPIAGDLLMLDGRRSLFPAASEPLDSLTARAAAGAIHPTGPLAGNGGTRPEHAAAALEESIVGADDPLLRGLQTQRVTAARRALRVAVRDLWFVFESPTALRVGFDLPPGAYATTVLQQILVLTETDQRSST